IWISVLTPLTISIIVTERLSTWIAQGTESEPIAIQSATITRGAPRGPPRGGGGGAAPPHQHAPPRPPPLTQEGDELRAGHPKRERHRQARHEPHKALAPTPSEEDVGE